MHALRILRVNPKPRSWGYSQPCHSPQWIVPVLTNTHFPCLQFTLVEGSLAQTPNTWPCQGHYTYAHSGSWWWWRPCHCPRWIVRILCSFLDASSCIFLLMRLSLTALLLGCSQIAFFGPETRIEREKSNQLKCSALRDISRRFWLMHWIQIMLPLKYSQTPFFGPAENCRKAKCKQIVAAQQSALATPDRRNMSIFRDMEAESHDTHKLHHHWSRSQYESDSICWLSCQRNKL